LPAIEALRATEDGQHVALQYKELADETLLFFPGEKAASAAAK
jgi:hypothetical protein